MNQGQFLSFGGTASDGVGLTVITVNVTSPKVTNYTVSSSSVSGTSKSLSAYGFDTGNSTYAGVGGSYTVTIFAKDSSNNVSARKWTSPSLTPDFTEPTFSSSTLNGYSDPGSFTVNQGQFLSFGGTASDGVGLTVITVNVTSPKVTNYTVSSSSVSGTSKSLSAYGFDTGNSTYAGVGGSYTVTIFAKDSSNNVSARSWNFTVVTPDFTAPTSQLAATLNGYSDPGNFTVNQGQFLSFGGTASDGVGLTVITVKVSSPKVTDYTVSTASVVEHGAFGLRFRYGQLHVCRGRRQLHRHDLR